MPEAERARVVCVAVTWAGLCWALRGGRWAGVCRDEEGRRMFGAGSGWREGRKNAARRGGGRCREAGSRSAVGSKAGSRRGRSQAAARRGRGVERRVRGATACGAGEGDWQSGGAGGGKARRDALRRTAPGEYPARREARSADRRGAVRRWARGSALVGAALGDTRHCAPPVLARGPDGRAEGRCERAAPPGCKGRLITGRGV